MRVPVGEKWLVADTDARAARRSVAHGKLPQLAAHLRGAISVEMAV